MKSQKQNTESDLIGVVTFFLGLGINCLFYGFITERIVSALSKRN